MTDDGYTVPKKTAGDVAHAAVKAVLAAVPVVGGSGVELFQFVIQAPLEKRRVEWMERIGQGLARLEAKGIDIAGLCESEEFVSAVMYGSQIALRTHQEKKLEALRNAILNVAACSAPEEALQLMFLNFVDERLGRARRAWLFMRRSMRCRRHEMPSASRSCHTRRAP